MGVSAAMGGSSTSIRHASPFIRPHFLSSSAAAQQPPSRRARKSQGPAPSFATAAYAARTSNTSLSLCRSRGAIIWCPRSARAQAVRVAYGSRETDCPTPASGMVAPREPSKPETSPSLGARRPSIPHAKDGVGDADEKSPLLCTASNGNASTFPDDGVRPIYPRSQVSLWSRLTFSYLRPFFSKSQPLCPADLFEVPEHLSADFNAQNIYAAWDAELLRNSARPSLVRALFWSGALRSFITAGPLKLLYDVLLLVSPVVYGRIIAWFSGTSTILIGFGYVTILFAFSLLADGILLQKYYYSCSNSGIQVDRSLALLLQRKALKLSSVGRSSSGELVSLLSVDCKSLDDELFMHAHLMWSAPLQVCICVFLLLRLLGKPALFGVGVMFVMSVLAVVQAGVTSNFIEKKMRISDERLRRLSELFEIYRQIKMFVWERVFQRNVDEKRTEQLTWTWRAGIADAFGWGLWDATPVLVAAATFSVASSSWFPGSPPLTPGNVFPALAIFDILTFPLTIAPEVFQGLVTAKVSLGRLISFLLSDEVVGRTEDVEGTSERENRAGAFCGGNLAWGSSIVMRDAMFEIPKGQLTMIVGPVGAGKSSLIAGLLGELSWDAGRGGGVPNTCPVLNGAMVGYVPQSPWVYNDTVRNNILFLDDGPFDEDRYARVIQACGLEQDLSIMPAHDRTEIGSRGLTLSGGQRARIALARAVYARADVYIFDSTLAALDAHLAAHVFNKVLGPGGLLADKARVFVTHSLDFCPQADRVITLKAGRVARIEDQSISDRGDSSTQTGSNPEAAQEFEKPKTWLVGVRGDNEANVSGCMTSDELEEDAAMATRDVLWYVCFAGIALPLLTAAVILASQTSSLMVDLTVARWTESVRESLSSQGPAVPGRPVTQYYFKLMLFLSFICCLFQISRQIASVIASTRIAKNLHEAMLGSVLRVPVTFFDATPRGRLLNRFGRDVSDVDSLLPTFLTAGVAYFLYTALLVGMVCWISPLAIVVLLPLSVAYARFTYRFTQTKRQLQRLASASESPLFSCFQESLAGLEVIRAFGRSRAQEDVFRHFLDLNTQASLMKSFGDRYFEGRIAIMGALSIASAASAAIFARGALSPSLAGLSLLWAFKVEGKLGWLPFVWTQIETGLVASDRVHWYVSYLPREAPCLLPTDDALKRANWPSSGALRLNSISMRYRQQHPLALRGVSLHVPGGQHLGIVGRSGSGKSSLMMALLRLVELESGQIEIDGVDIRHVGLDLLRSQVCVIPQEPALFRGTVRSNLDPESDLDDAALWRALELAQMRDTVRGLGGLDTLLEDAGGNLSAGERQLLALARALLRRCRVIVLDEASSSVDWDTDAKIQRAIRGHLGGGATVLTIAHRLRTIAQCDAVVVLDRGTVVEGPAPPAALLAIPDSRLAALAAEMGADAAEELRHGGLRETEQPLQ